MTAAQRRRALALYATGMTAREAAEDVGAPVSTVHQAVRAAGMSRGPSEVQLIRNRVRPRVGDDVRAAVVELYRSGLSAVAVRRRLLETEGRAPDVKWIRKAVAESGAKRSRSAAQVLRYGKRKRAAVAQLASSDGVPRVEIARRIGVSAATVYRWAALLRRQEERAA